MFNFSLKCKHFKVNYPIIIIKSHCYIPFLVSIVTNISKLKTGNFDNIIHFRNSKMVLEIK